MEQEQEEQEALGVLEGRLAQVVEVPEQEVVEEEEQEQTQLW